MLAMNESSRARALVPPVRARLDRVASVVPVGPGDAFLVDSEIRAALRGIDVLLTGWGCPPITPHGLDAPPNLQPIVHAAGSLKGCIVPAAFQRGIMLSPAL